jgi:hypothetical protein
MDAQYGQQDRYDVGGMQGGAINGNGAVGGDFWSEVSVSFFDDGMSADNSFSCQT